MMIEGNITGTVLNATVSNINISVTTVATNSSTAVTQHDICSWHLDLVEWVKLVLLLTGFFGNGLTVLVIIFNKPLHSTTFAVICSIAMADFLYCFAASMWICFIVGYLDISGNFRRYVQCVNDAFYAFLNTAIYHLLSICYLASALFITVLSVFRFIIIYNPLKSKFILNKFVVILSFSLIWILATIIAVWKSSSEHDLSSIVANAVDTLIEYLIPLIIIIIFHSLKIISLKRNQFGSTEKEVKKMERIVLIIILTSSILPLPWQIFRFLHVIEVYNANYYVQTLSGLCLQINTCINPIVYAFLSPDVRRRIVKLLTGPCRMICKGRKPVLPQIHIVGKQSGTPYTVGTDETNQVILVQSVCRV